MSTEHQKYSTANQSDAIVRYAEQRGFTLVRTYEDTGKSGLRLDGRNALKQLISDVRSGNVDFRAVLVYDVSRWGRFQDADESAYYEFICKEAGISVHYCAEQFENDGIPAEGRDVLLLVRVDRDGVSQLAIRLEPREIDALVEALGGECGRAALT